MKHFIYLTAVPDYDAEIIRAETLALCGAEPDHHGIAISPIKTDCRRAAFVKIGAEMLFQSNSLSEIIDLVQAERISAEGFRVSVIKKPKKLKLNTFEIAHKIGAVIGGRPNLAQSTVTFWLIATPEIFYFAKEFTASDRKWIEHSKKPHMTSSSLPTRIARSMINMTISNCYKSIIDPCCGSGTIVIEAAQIGFQAIGYDINYKMIQATKKNVACFGLTAEIAQKDACEIDGTFDAVITDLPYGISLSADRENDFNILKNLRKIAPKVTVVAMRDLTSDLLELDYRIVKIVPVEKHTITRKIFITETNY